jgi:hypothetical protein
MHILYQFLYVLRFDFIIILLPCAHAPLLYAFNVLARNSHIYHFDIDTTFRFRLFNGRYDAFNGFFNIRNDTSLNTNTLALPYAQNFYLMILQSATH